MIRFAITIVLLIGVNTSGAEALEDQLTVSDRKEKILLRIESSLRPQARKIGCAIYIKKKIARLFKREEDSCPADLAPGLEDYGHQAIDSMLIFAGHRLDERRDLLEKPTAETIVLSGSVLAFLGWPESWIPSLARSQAMFKKINLGLVLSLGLTFKKKSNGNYEIDNLILDVEWGDRAVFPTVIASVTGRLAYMVSTEEESASFSERYSSWYMPSGPIVAHNNSQLALGFTAGASVPPLLTMAANFKTKGSRLKINIGSVVQTCKSILR